MVPFSCLENLKFNAMGSERNFFRTAVHVINRYTYLSPHRARDDITPLIHLFEGCLRNAMRPRANALVAKVQNRSK